MNSGISESTTQVVHFDALKRIQVQRVRCRGRSFFRAYSNENFFLFFHANKIFIFSRRKHEARGDETVSQAFLQRAMFSD